MARQCGAQTRSRGLCHRPAKAGSPRCWLHGLKETRVVLIAPGAVVNRRRSKSCTTSSRRSSRSLISRTVTPNTPRKSLRQCHLRRVTF